MRTTRFNFFTLAAFAMAVGSASSAHADLVASYTFDNPTGELVSFASSDTNANTTASDFSSGSGFNLNSTAVTNAFTSEGLGLSDGVGSGLADAISANDYYNFSINAVAGSTFNLTDISLDVGRSQNGAQDFYLFSSVDGFTETDVLASQTGVAVSAGNVAVVPLNFNFESPVFGGLSTVEFRVYVDNRFNNSISSSGTFVDNVVVNADIVSAIPEPTSLGLLGLITVGFVTRRRR